MIASSVLIITGVGMSAFFMFDMYKDKTVINVELSEDENYTETIEFEYLNIAPGESIDYTLNIDVEYDGEFDIVISFSDNDESLTLKEYAYARVTMGDTEICDVLLKDLFKSDELRISAETAGDKKTTIKITYYMLESVGDEAQNAEANFTVTVTAENTEGIYD